MTIASFPQGFRGGFLLKEIPKHDTEDGQVHWVDDTDGAAANPGTFMRPVATILQAVALCSGSRKDTIYVKAGYTQDVSDATELVCEHADTHIIGLGRGTSRPTLNFDAAAASIVISATNVTFANFIADANFADVASAFTVTATDATISDFVFTENDTNKNWVAVVDTGAVDNQADGLTLTRCHCVWADAAGNEAIVNVDEDIDLLTVQDCYVTLPVNGTLASIMECAAGKDTTHIQVHRNYMSRLVTAAAIQILQWNNTTTTNTGLCSHNESRSLDIAGELLATAGSNVHFTDNLSTSAIDKSGYPLPIADS